MTHGIPFSSVKQRLDKYNIKIGFAYNTLSNNGKNNKFRVCFFLDTCIASATVYESVVKTFMIMFPECDNACKNANRIFLGGKEIIYKSSNVETERTTIHSIFSGVQQYIKDTQYNKYSKIMKELATNSSLMLSSNTIWLKQRFVTREQANILHKNQTAYENIDCCSYNWCANKDLHLQVFGEEEITKLPNDILFVFLRRFEIKDDNYCKAYEICISTKKITEMKQEKKAEKKKNQEKHEQQEESKILYDIPKVKMEIKPIRNFDFEKLEQKCRIYAELKNDTEWLYYPQLFNMACNFASVESGEKNFLDIIKNSKYDTYRSRNWQVIFNEIRHLCYRPTNCINFCPYHDTCNHASNMILTAKTPKKEIVKVGTPQYITLEQMEQKLKNTFNAIMKDTSNSIHLVLAQTGAGKTHEYVSLMKKTRKNTLAICCPIHSLIQDIKKRCKESGIPIKIAQDLPMLHDKKLYSQIIRYYKLGLYIEADKLIKEKISELTDTFFSTPLTPIQKIDYKKLKKYYDNNKNILDFDGNIIITHNKLLHLDQRILKDRTIIVDEDILQDLLPIDTISLEDFKITNYTINTAILEDIKKKLKIVKNASYNTIIPVNDISITKDRNLTESEIKFFMNDISSNLFNFCKCTAVWKFNSSIKENEPIDHSKDMIYCSIKNNLPNSKIIVLSATVNANLYKSLFTNRNIVFHKIGEVEYQGKVYQNYKNSFSKSSLKTDDTTILSVFNELQERYVNADFESITYKDYTLSKHDIYFRKLVGVDFLSGKNCVVIGTPNLPEEVYQLKAYQIYGVEIKESWRPQEVNYNGYKFFFNTFTDKRLQELHLWSVESELEQAVGRARLLRNNCQVHVYSNFPVKQAIFKDKNLLE